MVDRFAVSKSLLEESRKYLAGGVSTSVRKPSRPFPLFFERGEGAQLYDVDGNRYIDYTLGWGPLIHGHSHPAMVQAVGDQLRRGQTYGAQHRWEIETARRLVEMVPCADLVCFSNTGTEAVMAAMRLARAHTGRRLIVRFEGHYHGWSDGAMISYTPPLDKAGPYEEPIPVPGSLGIPPSALGDVIVAPWNDLAVLDRLLARHAGEVAGVIMEPYAFNTGIVFPVPGYLEGVRKLCDKHKTILIFDEVITGFRVGLTSAQGRLGVIPDLAIFGKAIAGGFPLSAIAGKRQIMETIASGKIGHAGTFNGNPIVTSAATACLDLLRQDGGRVYERLENLARRLAAGVRGAAARAGVPVLVNQVGSVCYMHFTREGQIANYRDLVNCDNERYFVFVGKLVEKGFFPTWRGLWYLSTVHTEAHIDETITAVGEALAEAAGR